MAKKDINFNLFWKYFYPENNPPYARYDVDYFDDHVEKFVGEIYNVTVDDLLRLTEEELNCVPSYWLYHWTWCHGDCDNKLSPNDFFHLVEAKREEYKAIDIALLREVQSFLKAHKQFSTQEMQQALSISYEEFLKVAYWLIVNGKVQYRDNQYFVVG